MQKNPIAWLSGAQVLICAGLTCTAFAADTPGSVHPDVWPAVRAPIPQDPALEARIDTLLADMTAEQKVGQLIQADIGSLTLDDLRHYPLGSILNGGDSGPGNDDLAPASEWLAAADRFYDASIGGGAGRRAPFSVTTAGQLELSVGNIRLESGTDGLLNCAR